MSEFKQYRRKGLSEMRPYVPGEDMSKISVSQTDSPEEGGMIARNPDDHEDQWYVAKEYFQKNLEEVRTVEKSTLVLDYEVFPSEEKTISVVPDQDYGGAHEYFINNSLGFKDGKAEYVKSIQHIQFVQKNLDGTMIPGIQSEQLAYVLIDRAKKLNARFPSFPSVQNEKMIAGLQMFLDACRERVQDRIDRGVMGDLKK